MKIIIAGAGRVGGSLAEMLCREGHDITLIDKDAETISHISNTVDAICIVGSATNPDVLSDAGAREADVFLAMTEQDEVNMICGAAAHHLGTKHIVARVRDPQYLGKSDFLESALGISSLVNPEYECAAEISRNLRLPSAARVDNFSKGRVEIAEYRILKDGPLDGAQLKDLRHRFGAKVLVSLIERNGQPQIPNGDFIIRNEDILSITGTAEELKRFFSAVSSAKSVKSAMIMGGGRISIYLARLLIRSGIAVTIIENDRKTCDSICELIPEACVICGDATRSEVLLEEGIKDSDAFVALTGDDGDNIITSIYARHCGVRKSVTKINHEHFAEVVNSSDLDSIVIPKEIVVNHITRYVRALSDSEGGGMKTLYRLCDGQAEAIEFRVNGEAGYTGAPLRELKLKKDVLIANIVRNKKSILPDGDTVIQIGDHVVIVALEGKVRGLDDILAN